MKRRTIALLLAAALCALPLAACADAQAADLMADITPHAEATDAALTETARAAVADVSARLLAGCFDGSENVLVSPLSVLLALGMTANGAAGETLAQMEQTLGLPVGELNGALSAWAAALPSDDGARLELANSIWLRDDASLTVSDDFLQANADFYGAQAYQAAFDADTVRDVNRWVEEHTDGMIDEIVQRIPAATMLYLINALSFDASWDSVYTTEQVSDGTFTTEEGAAQTAEFMYQSEFCYLADENTTGFCKDYAGGRYAFAALLPDEGISLTKYVQSLTGEKWLALLGGAAQTEVRTAIPKFQLEYGTELSRVLQSMGMTDAFDADAADFSALGGDDGDKLWISAVLHKTAIAVDERGTKAGAVTAVAMAGSAMQEEVKTVYLDRPFVYAIVDCQTNLPIFLGVVTSLS